MNTISLILITISKLLLDTKLQTYGKSCLSIKQSCSACNDGFYWIGIEGSPVKVYCDMNVDEGELKINIKKYY